MQKSHVLFFVEFESCIQLQRLLLMQILDSFARILFDNSLLYTPELVAKNYRYTSELDDLHVDPETGEVIEPLGGGADV